MDIKAYLEHEKHSASVRSEYLEGNVRDMDAENDIHFGIRMNMAFLLKEHLSSNAFCKIYIAEMRVYIPSIQTVLHPDIVISCDMEDAQQNDYKERPSVVVEVVSETSGGYDRGHKFSLYRHLPSLQEYVLIDATRTAVDCFRAEEERWSLYCCDDSGGKVEIPSIAFSCDMEDIYQDIFADD